MWVASHQTWVPGLLRGFELTSTVGSQMTYPSSIAGPELRISKDLGRLGDRGFPYIFQTTLQLSPSCPLCLYSFKLLAFNLAVLSKFLLSLWKLDRSCRHYGFTTVRDRALQDLETDCIATSTSKERRTIRKMSGLSTQPASDTELCRIERTDSHGLHEHGRPVNHRRSRGLFEPLVRTCTGTGAPPIMDVNS